MGLFSTKDWNVIAIIFERPDLYRVNGNRGKGKEAVNMREGAKKHARTLYWAVFDQKGAFLEGEPGPAKHMVPPATLSRLAHDIVTNKTVLAVLAALEKKEADKVSKALEWSGYPMQTPAS